MMDTLFARSVRNVAAAVALSVMTASVCANAQRHEPSIRSRVQRRPYVDRPLTAGFLHLDVLFGFGAEYVDYYRSYLPTPGQPLWGVGAHLDAAFGITERIEIGAGVGFRFAEEQRLLQFLAPDRYARVNHEWLPTGLELARQPAVLGEEYITNPYVRARVALLDHEPVFIGIDAIATLPIAYGTCFTFDLGVPIHAVVAAHIMRIETGVYTEFVPCEVPPFAGVATRLWSLIVPLRMLFNITPRFWLGIRSGFDDVGYSLDSRNWAIQLGLEGGVRILPRLDLMFNVVAPEFVHTDPMTNRNVWLDRIGFGFAIQLFLL
jgi:hypothetical protein